MKSLIEIHNKNSQLNISFFEQFTNVLQLSDKLQERWLNTTVFFNLPAADVQAQLHFTR